MTYKDWVLENSSKRRNLQQKLESWGLSQPEVIDYFRFENMRDNEPTYCGLYEINTKCHNIENLNCYLCACPHFRFKDKVGFEKRDGRIVFSFCSIDSKNGKLFESEEAIHQDCSDCFIPHSASVALKHYETLDPIKDTYSILELIRGWQLADLLNKYKLF